MQVPKSVALPFGTFEKVLKDKANAAVAKQISSLQKQLVRLASVDGMLLYLERFYHMHDDSSRTTCEQQHSEVLHACAFFKTCDQRLVGSLTRVK